MTGSLVNLCTIAMRGGSKGLPNKNIRPLNGQPLMKYTIDQARATNIFDQIVISTDSDEIAELCRSFGVETWFLRPNNLAEDETPKIPVIRHALLEAEKHFETKFDVIVDLDVTSPLRIISDIRDAHKQFLSEARRMFRHAAVNGAE